MSNCEVFVSSKSVEYWNRINNCARGIFCKIAKDCWNFLVKNNGPEIKETIKEYINGNRKSEAKYFIESEIMQYFNNLSERDKLLIRVSFYRLGDEFTAGHETEKIIISFTDSFRGFISE